MPWKDKITKRLFSPLQSLAYIIFVDLQNIALTRWNDFIEEDYTHFYYGNEHSYILNLCNEDRKILNKETYDKFGSSYFTTISTRQGASGK